MSLDSSLDVYAVVFGCELGRLDHVGRRYCLIKGVRLLNSNFVAALPTSFIAGQPSSVGRPGDEVGERWAGVEGFGFHWVDE